MTDTQGDLGDLLGVWAHPDDEAWGSAGLMARAVDAGRRVVCVTATKGEAGFPADDPRPAAERAALREAELDTCLNLLGVTEHHWLDYPDGGCAEVSDEKAVARILEFIDAVRPDTILTFGPDGGTGHPDHVSACRWTTLAVQQLGPSAPRLLYATKTQDWIDTNLPGVDVSSIMMIEGFLPEAIDADALAVHLTCDDALLDRKVAALRAQTSQIEPQVAAYGVELFRTLTRDEFFRDPTPDDVATLAAATAYSRR